MRFDYHGHATFSLYTDAGVRLLFDPYFDNNPKFDGTHGDVGAVDFVLASHGHFDHFEDAVPVLKATGATQSRRSPTRNKLRHSASPDLRAEHEHGLEP